MLKKIITAVLAPLGKESEEDIKKKAELLEKVTKAREEKTNDK